MSNISEWSSNANNNNSGAPDGFPEGMNPSGVNNAAREVMAAVRRQYEDAEWIDYGDTPTYASTTSFTVAGDLTSRYSEGRKLKITDSSTLYGVVSSSSYSSPNTTVTVTLDTGVISASISDVALGLISSNSAMHRDIPRSKETVAKLQADVANFNIGDTVYIEERGAYFKCIAYTTPNGYDIIDGDGSTKVFYLSDMQGPFSEQEFSLQHFGAVGDGTDEIAIFLAADNRLPSSGGKLLIPPPATNYLISASFPLKKRTTYYSLSKYGCQINFSGGADNMLEFVGSTEAEDCNITIRNLDLVSTTSKTGTAIRARNFTGLTVEDCSFYNFDKNIHVDWGIGLYAYRNNISTANRGIQIGGDITEHGVSAGIRGGGGARFMDTIHLSNNVFSSNVIDISDSGSIDSLGGLFIEGGNCFESSVSPVTGKVANMRIAGRKNFYINNVWFENPENNRTGIILSNYDYDSVLQDVPNGKIESNYFLMNGGASTIGVDVQRGFASIGGENTFNHLGGGRAISLGDTTSPSEVGQNVYLGTYTSSEPILQTSEIHQILDPSRNSQLQSVSIGGSGGEITKTLKASGTLTFSAPSGVPGNSDQTITVTGAVFGDFVTVASNAAVETNRVLTGFVSAADTVTVRFTQLSGAAAVPTGSGSTFKVLVLRT